MLMFLVNSARLGYALGRQAHLPLAAQLPAPCGSAGQTTPSGMRRCAWISMRLIRRVSIRRGHGSAGVAVSGRAVGVDRSAAA
jgi:hypothetical protein